MNVIVYLQYERSLKPKLHYVFDIPTYSRCIDNRMPDMMFIQQFKRKL